MKLKLNKKRKKYLIISFIIVAFLFSAPYMFGMTEDEGINIYNIAQVEVWKLAGSSATPINAYDTVTVSTIDTMLQDVRISVRVMFGGTYDAPEGFRAYLQTFADQTIETQIAVKNYQQDYVFTFLIDGALQGTYLYHISFGGAWDAGDHFHILYGDTQSFWIQNDYVPQPNPVSFTETPEDYTCEPDESKYLTWKWIYNGDCKATLTENGVVLKEETYTGTEDRTFMKNYASSVSGDIELKLTVTPTDGSSNIAASDIVRVHVEPGGEPQDFPPSADSIFVSMDVAIYPIGIMWDYGWDIRAGEPLIGLQEFAVAGVMYIQVVANPADALSSVYVRMYEETGYVDILLTLTDEYYGVWTGSLDTNELDAGVHTIEVYCVDKADNNQYLLATVNIGVRSLTWNSIAIIVVIVGSVPVTLMMSRRIRNYMTNKRKHLF